MAAPPGAHYTVKISAKMAAFAGALPPSVQISVTLAGHICACNIQRPFLLAVLPHPQ
jgi:hypothetical protein